MPDIRLMKEDASTVDHPGILLEIVIRNAPNVEGEDTRMVNVLLEAGATESNPAGERNTDTGASPMLGERAG